MNDTWIIYDKKTTTAGDKSTTYEYVDDKWQKSKYDTGTKDSTYIANYDDQKNQYR